MKLKINDKIISFNDIAKKYKIENTEIINNLETHYVKVEFDDWPCQFTNSLRYLLCMYYPTKRMVITNIETTDEKVILDSVRKNVANIKVAEKCDIENFTYTIEHNHKNMNPIFVDLRDSKIAKYINAADICVIGKGHTLQLTCSVVEKSGIEGMSNHYFASSFNREKMKQQKKQIKTEKFSYDTGIVSFIYTENIDAENVVQNAFNMFKEIINEVLNNMDNYLRLNIDTPYLLVPKDRSRILANCMVHFIYLENMKILFSISSSHNELENSSKIMFPSITQEQIIPIINDGLKSLLKFIG